MPPESESEVLEQELEHDSLGEDNLLDQDGGDPEDDAAELPPAITPKSGNISPGELEALRPVCTMADENHQKVLGHIKDLRSAENVLKKFQSRQGDTTPQDVDKAKQQFHQAKQSYMQLGNEINEGIKQIHRVARTYPEDILVQNLYKTYLAKLLSSMEARNPLEPFVETLSMGIFDFERHEVTIDTRDTQLEITVEKKTARIMEDSQQAVTMLESRYQKRQLSNRLRQGEKPQRVVRKLKHFLRRDPDDLHTYIWLANILSDQYATERNQNTRVTLRDDILSYCKRAFSKIDDFLNLQGIQQLADRDRRRAEYIKTITGIRKPLLGSSSG